MDRSWVYRVITYSLLTLVAFVVLTPTIATWLGKEDRLPAWMQEAPAEEDQLGLDLQGGLHLVYEVNVDKAVTDKADRLASDIEDRLHKDKKRQGPHASSREGRDEIVLTFKNPADGQEARPRVPARTTASLSRTSPRRGHGRGPAAPRPRPRRRAARLRAPPGRSRPSATASTSSASPSRPSSRRAPTSSSSSPASSPTTSSGSRSIIGRTAQLEFKIVDDGSEYMKKVAALASAKKAQFPGIDDRPRRLDREGLGQAARGRLPARRRDESDAREVLRRAHRRRRRARPITRSATSRCRRKDEDGEPRPTSYWRTYYLHKRAALTGEYLTERRRQTWDQQTGRPEVSFAVRPPGRQPLREGLTGDEHRPQDGHHPRREDQHARRSSRARIGGGRGRITHGRLRRSLRSSSRRPRTWSPCCARARCRRRCKQDLRDPGRPDDGRATRSTRPSSRCASARWPSSSSCSSTTGCRGSSRTSR